MDYSTFVPGIMSAPAGAPLPASPQQDAAASKKRNRMLCQRCRHDKQGCHPQNRNWDRGEKCERCRERGYECSAPEKAPFKQRKRRVTLATSRVHTSTHTSAMTSQDATTSMPRLTPTMSAPTPGNSRPRPIDTWGGFVESIPLEDTVISSTQPDMESAVFSERKSNEQEARIILAKLGDLNATRVVLLSDLELCKDIEKWIGHSARVGKIRDAIKAAIAAIVHDFKAGVALATSYATKAKDIGPYKEAFVSQVELVVTRFRQEVARPESSTADEAVVLMDDFDVEVVQERLHELHKRKKVWSAADYLLGNAYGRTSSRQVVHGQSENDVVFCYVKASESIKDVFSDIVPEDLEHRKILCTGLSRTKDSISAIPPCHLAVSQANPSVLLALWKKSAMPLWDVDYLHRTPVHSATYAGKVQGLQQIFQVNPSTATNTGCDAFGMTPLAISACKDDIKTFIKLERAGAVLESTNYNIVDNTGTTISILGLAARNGSVKVVEHIVSHHSPFTFQVGSSELCQALLNDQVHIALILIEWHCKPDNNYDLSDQIASAQQVADQRGFQDISDTLKSLIPSRQNGIQALETMVFDDFTNHDAFEEDQTQYDSSQFDSSQGCDFDNPYWSFSELHVLSLAPSDMQDHIGSIPSSGSGPSFTVPSNHAVRQSRHRGPSRMDPP